jgi:hypothetical protein
MLRKMRIIISSLLLILALHFLLQGINYKKIINIGNTPVINEPVNKIKENFEIIPIQNKNVKKELLQSIQCQEPGIVASNKFIDNKNDSNFQSDVLNVNRFYKKNVNDSLDYPKGQKKLDGEEKVNEFTEISKYSNQPDTWAYKDELVMNGGELLNGITGYDNLIDQYSTYGQESLLDDCSDKDSCVPSNRGTTTDDDLRMGLGVLNKEQRSTS